MKQIKSIQSLRAMAAILVVIRHCWEGPEIAAFGVDLFFVISGFIMVHTSRDDFGSLSSPLKFLARRIVRIIPTYWISTFLIVLFVGHTTYSHFFKSFFLIAENVTPLNAPGWTLIYEMFFYILFAILLPLRRRHAILLLLICLFSLSIVGSSSNNPYIAYYGRALIIEFGLGAIIGLIYHAKFKIGARSSVIWMTVSCLILALSSYTQVNGTNWERLFLWGFPAAFIVFAALSGPSMRLTECSIVLKVGDASYSIYVTHWLWIITYGNRFPLLAFLISIIFGMGYYWCFEGPLVRLLRPTTAEVSGKAWQRWLAVTRGAASWLGRGLATGLSRQGWQGSRTVVQAGTAGAGSPAIIEDVVHLAQ